MPSIPRLSSLTSLLACRNQVPSARAVLPQKAAKRTSSAEHAVCGLPVLPLRCWALPVAATWTQTPLWSGLHKISADAFELLSGQADAHGYRNAVIMADRE